MSSTPFLLLLLPFFSVSLLSLLIPFRLVNCTAINKRHNYKTLSMTSSYYNSDGTKRSFGRIDALKYLKKYYLFTPKYVDTVGNGREYKRVLQRFQKLYKLPQTGLLDEKTRHTMQLPRCGMPDIMLNEDRKRRKRFVEQDLGKLRGETIHYRVHYPNPKRHRNMQKKAMNVYVNEAVDEAFKIWEEHIPLRFVKVRKGRSADIQLAFVTRRHGDEYPFDGPGNEVGHAFYPNNPVRKGHIHLDDDEPWGPIGRNLRWVVAHEIGHTLGLAHSDPSTRSIMVAQYHGYYGVRPRLHLSDIANIQRLYGSRLSATRMPISSTTTTIPPLDDIRETAKSSEDTAFDICSDASLDAVVRLPNGTVYAFKNDWYWRVDRTSLPSRPSCTSRDWGLTGSLDAMFTDRDEWTWAIQGDRAWQIDASAGRRMKLFDSQPMRHYEPFSNYEYRKVDAVLQIRGHKGDDPPVFYFLGPKYWMDATYDGKKDESFARQIREITRSLTSVDAAISVQDEQEDSGFSSFLFSGQVYYKVVMRRHSLRIANGYPRRTSVDWFGCPS